MSYDITKFKYKNSTFPTKRGCMSFKYRYLHYLQFYIQDGIQGCVMT